MSRGLGGLTRDVGQTPSSARDPQVALLLPEPTLTACLQCRKSVSVRERPQSAFSSLTGDGHNHRTFPNPMNPNKSHPRQPPKPLTRAVLLNREEAHHNVSHSSHF